MQHQHAETGTRMSLEGACNRHLKSLRAGQSFCPRCRRPQLAPSSGQVFGFMGGNARGPRGFSQPLTCLMHQSCFVRIPSAGAPFRRVTGVPAQNPHLVAESSPRKPRILLELLLQRPLCHTGFTAQMSCISSGTIAGYVEDSEPD